MTIFNNFKYKKKITIKERINETMTSQMLFYWKTWNDGLAIDKKHIKVVNPNWASKIP